MKRFFTLLAIAVITLQAMAQHDAMKFAGPSQFGVEAMNAWQDNAEDTIVFKLNSLSDADITLPAMTYNAMGMTIPSFTIHAAKFTFDAATRNSVFEDQTYSEVITVDGVEKTITGYSLTGTYNHAAKVLTISTKLAYGRMPVQVTYKIEASYVVPTGIDELTTGETSDSSSVYDIAGNKVSTMVKGRVYISKGKKVIIN